MDERFLQTVDNTINFMRMTAIELRRIAERAPEVGEELRRIAEQLDADAGDLSGSRPGSPRP